MSNSENFSFTLEDDKRKQRLKQARTITIISIILNLLLAGTKITVSLLFGSVSILADGVDSALDLLTSLLGFVAINMADKPADKDHQFGHTKFENFFTLGIALLLVSSSGLIAYQAIQKLILKSHLTFSAYNIGIAAVSIIIKGILVWIHLRVGKKIESPTLVANGLNFRTDVLTSFVVLISVSVGWIPVGTEGQTLYWLDPIIALIISIVIIYTAINITRESASVLLDKSVDPKILKEITKLAKENVGVRDVGSIRTRMIGSNIFLADLDILLNPQITIEEGHEIACEVEEEIKKKLPVKYLHIHMEPFYEAQNNKECNIDKESKE
ncbi:MAG TPA: cation diffusion facilitator family transporter [candidate division Zixibacteria bacterium]|nr:cation diffusion facilitator family transporter [candidate division Zixibacteria bacterium]